jgi:hypothetical protein
MIVFPAILDPNPCPDIYMMLAHGLLKFGKGRKGQGERRGEVCAGANKGAIGKF